jgi:spermidine synthase
VFPNGTAWANNVDGRGYDLVLLAQVEPTRIDIPGLIRRFADPAFQAVGTSLNTVGLTSPILLFATYAGQAKDMEVWLRDAAVNTDRNLRLQYLAGVGLNQYTAASIYEQIAQFRKSPDSLFIADEEFKRRLREAIQ